MLDSSPFPFRTCVILIISGARVELLSSFTNSSSIISSPAPAAVVFTFLITTDFSAEGICPQEDTNEEYMSTSTSICTSTTSVSNATSFLVEVMILANVWILLQSTVVSRQEGPSLRQHTAPCILPG
mmetsp:Transcript_4971/g.6482  ORF Transcript_4971/g.6482 Transcript_4971/m.6482 type:complete len:127 (-) Transcript_4971:181-561(-)